MGTKGMMVAVAVFALAGCVRASAEPPAASFACYEDGHLTVLVPAVDISMRASMVNGAMVEHWRVSPLDSPVDMFHDAGPGEVCGPEVPPPPMVD